MWINKVKVASLFLGVSLSVLLAPLWGLWGLAIAAAGLYLAAVAFLVLRADRQVAATT